jgi:hypothetical protein
MPERVEVHHFFDGIVDELAAMHLPPELEFNTNLKLESIYSY